ncbi:MAG: 2-oxoacid:acceptor oxidoreductase subunit alpha [Actinobacteria bacterium]|nr:2-oxoacid:acceptor oxidoreductase subunit alpha [Actinomycetota bacterium]MCL5887623.1 2-oxoacid:acceptor oxidoreductase subunit alpha [Actinomycetota bacterium]
MPLRASEEFEVRIRIGGPAGFGIKAAGQTLAKLFARSGLETFDLTEYPSLIKGGHNTYHLRVSTEQIHSHVLDTDILVALDQETVALHIAELGTGGAIMYDPDDFDPLTLGIVDLRPNDRCLVPVPLKSIVREAGGPAIMRNTASLGAVLGYIGFPFEPLQESLTSQFARKGPAIVEQNVAIAKAGYDHARANECGFPYRLQPLPENGKRLLVDGNEAVFLGAMAAGVGFYSAYPMTPASSLLHLMAAHGEKEGVVVKHAEDEIAAINMVIGAAFGGTRAMCATSGGGFSLMVEALGFAGVSETACVVGVFTRPGPATGMPTWTEQSDLRFVLHASQGEFPRVVLAPGDHQDAFDLTWRAFNLADLLQTPVIILGDTYLSDNRRTVTRFDGSEVSIDRGSLVTEGDLTEHPEALDAEGRYARYKDSPSGVSLRALPGVIGAEQIVNSYEHDERGFGSLGEDAHTRVVQNEKRMRKMELARDLVPPPVRLGPEQADLSIILFGSTKMPTLEAMGILQDEGIVINILQCVTLWPFPAEEVRAFLDSAGRTAVIEGNMTGQLRGLIREHCLIDVDETLNRYDGRPFSPDQIARWVKEVIQ